jgi:hypothetical protein
VASSNTAYANSTSAGTSHRRALDSSDGTVAANGLDAVSKDGEGIAAFEVGGIDGNSVGSVATMDGNKKPPEQPGAERRSGEETREPLVGFEPTTARLRIECSTPELQWQRKSRMPWRGFEPRRLSAPPPQDGVSTSFTTRAKTTGPTGLEPATSRVTVECSNQTELRPLSGIGGSCAAPRRHESDLRQPAPRVTAALPCRAHSHTHTLAHSHPAAHRSSPYDIARRGVEPLSAP